MSNPVGLMRPNASRSSTSQLDEMTARIMKANHPKTPDELLALMSDAQRDQIEQLAKLVLMAVSYSGDSYYNTVTSMYPRMSEERRKIIAHVLNKASPQHSEPKAQPPKSNMAASVLDEWIEVMQQPSSSFVDELIQSESGGSQTASHTTQDGRSFVGQLQFGQARLSDYQNATGESFTQEQFKQDLTLQMRVAAWHFTDIDKAIDGLGEVAQDYDRDGLKAVAHLGGVEGMRRYVKTKGLYNPSDELGTSLSDYYARFSTKQR